MGGVAGQVDQDVDVVSPYLLGEGSIGQGGDIVPFGKIAFEPLGDGVFGGVVAVGDQDQTGLGCQCSKRADQGL